jgi:hypothetical protein
MSKVLVHFLPKKFATFSFYLWRQKRSEFRRSTTYGILPMFSFLTSSKVKFVGNTFDVLILPMGSKKIRTSKVYFRCSFWHSDFWYSDFWHSGFWHSDFWHSDFWHSDFWHSDLLTFWFLTFWFLTFWFLTFWSFDFRCSDHPKNTFDVLIILKILSMFWPFTVLIFVIPTPSWKEI